MTKKDRKLPPPPASPFAASRRFGPEHGEKGASFADELAQAALTGKLDAVLDREFPGNENARKLVSAMLGMSGMADPSAFAPPPEPREDSTGDDAERPGPDVPSEIVEAAAAGDVSTLKDLLAREHERRSGTPAAAAAPSGRGTEEVPPETAGPREESSPEASFDRETLDELLRISRDEGVSIDWLVSRAIALYVRDYRATGRL